MDVKVEALLHTGREWQGCALQRQEVAVLCSVLIENGVTLTEGDSRLGKGGNQGAGCVGVGQAALVREVSKSSSSC